VGIINTEREIKQKNMATFTLLHREKYAQ